MFTLNHHESSDFVRSLTKGYATLILIILGLTPILAISYLHFFQDPALRFEHHLFHEIAIGISLLQSGFITIVTWRCYQHSGEPFQRWLMLGFLGFTLIYALHGAFTRAFDHNTAIFILYGPVARFIMATCFLVGLLMYGRQAEDVKQRSWNSYWLAWAGIFALINILVFALAVSSWATAARVGMEISALGLTLICFILIAIRGIRTPLMTIYSLSLVFFAQASLAFLLSSTWNHQWWLAHGIFAAGFMALSYGVIQAFLTTGSFSTVYSQAELMEQVKAEKARAEKALIDLQRAHKELEDLAATDSLTGAANRREFLARSEAEISRTLRSDAPLSMIMVDIDHFKLLNDQHGHQAGDKVLREFVASLGKPLRQSDLIGRIGGEEFALLLPETTREKAAEVAERLRRLVEENVTLVDGMDLRVTASFGVAQLGPDGTRYDTIMAAADQRMYQAKRQGRNRVVAQ